MNMKLNFEKFYQELLTILGNVYLKWKLMYFENYNFTVQRYVVDCFWNYTVWDIKSLTEFKNPATPGIKPVIH